jgi:hypothetical protein
VTLPPESIEPGKCYLLEGERHRWVRLVTHVLPSGRVRFESRDATETRAFVWAGGTADLSAFAEATLREVPCDWTPNADEAGR